MKKKLTIKPPPDFNFKSTVYSHGWSELAPFELDDKTWILRYVFKFADAKTTPISAAIYEAADGKIIVESESDFTDENKIIREVRHILRFDDDLSEFYKLLDAEKNYKWMRDKNAGRLIRSPTVFEDLIKTLCTTNCSWSLTKKMAANLVEELGEQAADGKRAFPTAEAMANVPPEFYRDQIRSGYRSPYFAEIAELVASGKVNPEDWLEADLPTDELKKEMKKLKGVGDYAAENLLKLVGRYDGLALDSWLRKQFYNKHNAESVCDDRKIHDFYKRFGDWRGLVIWCEMTERWMSW